MVWKEVSKQETIYDNTKNLIREAIKSMTDAPKIDVPTNTSVRNRKKNGLT